MGQVQGKTLERGRRVDSDFEEVDIGTASGEYLKAF